MQEAEFQFFTNSVTGELLCGRELTEELKTSIQYWLRRLGLYEARMRHPFSLSGGQMQKLVLLTAFLSPKQIVILDEPTAGLDRESQSWLSSSLTTPSLSLNAVHDVSA